jgi:hypothetical protein
MIETGSLDTNPITRALEDSMLPFYPLNQLPAINGGDRSPRPASRLEVRMQMLDHERKQYASMQLQAERQGHNPLTMALHAVNMVVASLIATITDHAHRVRQAATSRSRHVASGNHICVPGVDC